MNDYISDHPYRQQTLHLDSRYFLVIRLEYSFRWIKNALAAISHTKTQQSTIYKCGTFSRPHTECLPMQNRKIKIRTRHALAHTLQSHGVSNATVQRTCKHSGCTQSRFQYEFTIAPWRFDTTKRPLASESSLNELSSAGEQAWRTFPLWQKATGQKKTATYAPRLLNCI